MTASVVLLVDRNDYKECIAEERPGSISCISELNAVTLENAILND